MYLLSGTYKGIRILSAEKPATSSRPLSTPRLLLGMAVDALAFDAMIYAPFNSDTGERFPRFHLPAFLRLPPEQNTYSRALSRPQQAKPMREKCQKRLLHG